MIFLFICHKEKFKKNHQTEGLAYINKVHVGIEPTIHLNPVTTR